MKTIHHETLAYLFLRLAVGINILMHGMVRLGSNYDKFTSHTMEMFKETPLPPWIAEAFIDCIPPVEFCIGILISLGIFSLAALSLGSMLMICLLAGMCLLQKWDVVAMQMIYMFLYFLLIYFIPLNRWSLDRLFCRRPC